MPRHIKIAPLADLPPGQKEGAVFVELSDG